MDSWVGKIRWRRDSYPLQYSLASLVTQLVKNLPVMQETWVQSLGWEDPLEKRKATHSSILAWRMPWLYSSLGHKELDTTEQLSLFTFRQYNLLKTLLKHGKSELYSAL